MASSRVSLKFLLTHTQNYRVKGSHSLLPRISFRFSWSKEPLFLISLATHISLSVIPNCATHFHKKMSYTQQSSKRKEGGKNNRTLPTLWTKWTQLLVPLARDTGVLSQLFCACTSAAAMQFHEWCCPWSRAGRKKKITLNSPTCSLNCSFCCSLMVHSWTTLRKKKEKK